jgi:hypothetical protein
MPITPTGGGLGILIRCEPEPHHGWMSFSLWYSINKSLPDASVAVACRRGIPAPHFRWCWKLKVPYFQHDGDPLSSARAKNHFRDVEPLLVGPSVVAVREYGVSEVGPVPAKSEGYAMLVDYGGGCGKFVLSDWIHKRKNPPFDALASLRTAGMTANELKVFSVWDRCRPLYAVV